MSVAAVKLAVAPAISDVPLSDDERAMLVEAVTDMGLAVGGAMMTLVPLAGGVSSLIARVETGERMFCVKAALARLRVAADWQVPVDRNRHEVAWMRVAAAVVPRATPAILGHDPVRNVFAMTWLDPAGHPVWKNELLAGRVSTPVAAMLGDVLGRIHAATADRADIAETFATDANFHALRLEPYLQATARSHPDLAGPLDTLASRTAATRRVLVHGDVSPKNILVGPDGPVILDAECAWYGDPAFDLAFCLNHLALKVAHLPYAAADLAAAGRAMWSAYREHVVWERPEAVEARVATLMPALALARIDGKSPVEYLAGGTRDRVRATARAMVAAPPATLAEFDGRWAGTIA